MKFPRIRVSIPFVCIMAGLWMIDGKRIFLPSIVAIAIHELGHIVALLLCGARIEKIELSAVGIKVKVASLEYMPYIKEIIIAAAGPLAGFFTASIAIAAAKFINYDMQNFFVGLNIVISMINLIPVYPLDGGRIILSLLLMFLPIRVAYFIYYALDLIAIGALVGVCAVLAVKGSLNPSLIIFSVYVAMCGVRLRAPL